MLAARHDDDDDDDDLFESEEKLEFVLVYFEAAVNHFSYV